MIERRQAARERRKAPRAPLTAAVLERGCGGTQLAQACNIGTLGMTLRHLGGPRLPSTPVALVFQLPDGDPLIGVRAEVVSDRADGPCWTTGVRFVSLSTDDANRIERFVTAAR
jgi:hypothetical protein